MSVNEIKSLIKKEIQKKEIISSLKCNYHLVNNSLPYDVHGFVFDLNKLGYFKKGYVFAIYSEVMNVKKLFVLDSIFDNEDSCISKAKYFVSYFPLYGYSTSYDM